MVDTLGLIIFLVGIALLVAELAQPGYFVGVLGTTGIIVGILQMAWPAFLQSQWSWYIVPVVALTASLASIQFYKKFAPPAKAPETLASDALVGKTGRVVTPVEPHNTKGKVKIGGIVWSAESNSFPIGEGEDAVVLRVDGVHLVVERVRPNENPLGPGAAPASVISPPLG